MVEPRCCPSWLRRVEAGVKSREDSRDSAFTFFINLLYILRAVMKEAWFSIHKLNIELPISV